MAPIPLPVASKPNPINSVTLRTIGSAPLASPQWLVKGVLPLTGVALLSGQFASGKTFVGADLALSIVFDLPFLRRRVKPGGVLWIAAEGSGEIDSRIAAARAGKYKDGHSGEIPFFVTEPPAGLTQQGIILWLGNAVEQAESECALFDVDLRLVVVDTLAACFSIRDENDNAEAAGLMSDLGRIGSTTRVLVMPIAHHGKNAETGVRGASAYGAGADAILAVLATTDPLTGKTSKRSLALTKSRRGGTGPLGSFEVHSHVLGFDEDGDPITAGYVEFDTSDKNAPSPQARSKIPPLFFEAFDAAIQTRGQDFQIPDDGPVVRAVSVVEAKNEFMRRHATGNPGNGTDAKRKAWQRAFDTAMKEGLFAAYALPNGSEMIWRV